MSGAGKLTTIQSQHVWQTPKICLNCRQVRKVVVSPSFAAHGVQWRISFYPKSETELDQEYCSIYLHSCSDSEIKIYYEFCILDQDNKIHFFRKSNFQVFGKENQSWGYKRFMKNSVIMDNKNQILNDGKITILCKISTDSREIREYEDEESIGENSANESINYEKYFLNDMLSDVQFVVQEEVFHAHKFVLATQSEVFAAMFTHNMKENKESKVKIEDCNSEIFKEVLRYIYTGQVAGVETVVDDLLHIADKYMLQGLKLICENNLIKNLSNENIFDHLSIATKYNLSSLKKKAIKFIVSNSKELLNNI